MIIQEFKAEFNEYFQSPDAELILWLDKDKQWRGVIDHLKNDFRVVEFNGSQLEVKAEVELTWDKGPACADVSAVITGLKFPSFAGENSPP